MPPLLVIFDFDGTIADSSHAIACTAQVALASVGLPSIADEDFIQRIGLPLAQIFAEILPAVDEVKRADVVKAYREHYADISRQHTSVFTGMREILDDLRKREILTAIATGKSGGGAHRAIEELKLPPFARVVGTDDVPRPKPHPDMVTKICSELEVSADRTIVVGDTTFDIEMSVAAGAPCCGVVWGSHRREQLENAGATWIADTRDELAALFD